MRFGRRALAIFRRIPVWLYIVLFLIGVGFIRVYEIRIEEEAAARYLQIVDNFEKAPFAGVYWIINVYRVDHALLPANRPITTYETYIFDVVPKGAIGCSTSIRSIQMELIGAAFTIVPPYPQSRPIEDYCGGGALTSTPTITWDVLAKQAGLHVAALRIVGLDSQNHQVDDKTFEVPIWVKDPSALVPISQGLAVLSGIGTLLSILDWLNRRHASPK